MDTRSKIITVEEALERAAQCSVILASFDVLTAERIRRLREIRRESPCLIAILADVPGSLLNAAARAELAASLTLIDWVVIAEQSTQLTENAVNVYDERDADAQLAADLVRYVHQRNCA